jgi:hypothetical protein
MCKCMCVCVCLCTCMCVCVCVYVHVYVYMYVYVCVCTCTCTCRYLNVWKQIHHYRNSYQHTLSFHVKMLNSYAVIILNADNNDSVNRMREK